MAALEAEDDGFGFQGSKDFRCAQPRLAAAPAAELSFFSPVEGKLGRSFGLAYFRDAAAPFPRSLAGLFLKDLERAIPAADDILSPSMNRFPSDPLFRSCFVT